MHTRRISDARFSAARDAKSAARFGRVTSFIQNVRLEGINSARRSSTTPSPAGQVRAELVRAIPPSLPPMGSDACFQGRPGSEAEGLGLRVLSPAAVTVTLADDASPGGPSSVSAAASLLKPCSGSSKGDVVAGKERMGLGEKQKEGGGARSGEDEGGWAKWPVNGVEGVENGAGAVAYLVRMALWVYHPANNLTMPCAADIAALCPNATSSTTTTTTTISSAVSHVAQGVVVAAVGQCLVDQPLACSHPIPPPPFLRFSCIPSAVALYVQLGALEQQQQQQGEAGSVVLTGWTALLAVLALSMLLIGAGIYAHHRAPHVTSLVVQGGVKEGSV
ncbi:unnamed protein product [Closterium sp. Naga37s-1]|nr:unnamed protein product [Closterium sp. Naga37s-1]